MRTLLVLLTALLTTPVIADRVVKVAAGCALVLYEFRGDAKAISQVRLVVVLEY